MARKARRISTLASLIAAIVWPAATVMAQTAPSVDAVERRPTVQATPRKGAPPIREWEKLAAPQPDAQQPEILQSLPHPPAEPGSLFAPAPQLGPAPPDWEHPYFEPDPLLDPSDWPRPGWFADAEVGVVKTHLNFPVAEQVTTVLGATPVVQLGTAHLHWTAAPRVEVGYRLPSGFGEFSISDRYFNTYGSDTVIGPDGPASRRTEFMLNYADFDYASRELTPNPGWGLKFRGGLRAAQSFLGTRVDQPIAQAAAGSGVFAQRETNRNTSFGPHFALDLERRLARPSLSVLGNVDVAEMFTRVRQEFFAANTTLTPGGGYDSGVVVSHFVQQVPVLTLQLGLNWQPPRWSNSRLYVGYFGQFWYNFGTNSNVPHGPFLTPTYTQFDNQGVVARWSRNW